MAIEHETSRAKFAARMAEVCADLGIEPGHGQQAALGRLFGVTPKAARKWLMGEGFPEMAMALRICEKADVNVNWLLQGVGPKRGDKVAVRAMVLDEVITELPDTSRQSVLDFVGYTLEKSDGVFVGERLVRYMKMLDSFKKAPRKHPPPPPKKP
jgi:hypothetical protein